MKKAKKLIAALAVGLLLVVLLGFGSLAEEGKYHAGMQHLPNLGEPKPLDRVSISFITFSLHVSDYSWYVFDGLRARMAEYGKPYDLHLSAARGTGDHEGLLQLVREAIIRGTDIIAVHPTVLYANTSIIELAYEHKVPLIWFNVGPLGILQPLEENPSFSYVGYEHYEGGQMVGEFLADFLDIDDTIGLIRLFVGDYADKRLDGAVDVLKEKRPDVTILEEYGGVDRTKAYELATAFITGNPGIRVIYGGCSATAMGAYAAVENLEIENIGVIGYGCTQEEVEGVLENTLMGSVLRDPWDNGKIIGDLIIKWWEGREDEIEPGYGTFQKLIYSPDQVIEYVDPKYWDPWVKEHGIPEFDYVPERDTPAVEQGLHDPEHMESCSWLDKFR